MGCGCGRKKTNVKSKGYSSQKLSKAAKPKALKVPTSRSIGATKTCSRCSSKMRIVNRYVTAERKLVRFWLCSNKTCKSRIRI